MNLNNLPRVNVSDDVVENIRNYFFNNYRGGRLQKLFKGKFLINLFLKNNPSDNCLLYIEQTDNLTSISLIEKNKFEATITFDELSLVLNLENNKYFVSYENNLQVKSKYQLGDEFIFDTVQWYIIITFFINNFLEKLDYKITVSSKKKRKQQRKDYIIDKKFVDDVTRLGFEDDLEHSSLDTFNQIKTSIYYMDDFKKYLKDINMEKFIYLPFEEFVIDFDKDITQIYCKYNGDKNSLECIVFKSKLKVFAIDIALNDGRYKTYTFEDFFAFEFKINLDISLLKADIVNVIQKTLNFIAFFKVKKSFVKKDKNTENMEKSSTQKKSGNTSNNTVYINTHKIYTVDISSSIKTPTLRKEPVYVKPKWERRGHIRHLKDGREVYVSPASCSRKALKNDAKEVLDKKNPTTKYIIC